MSVDYMQQIADFGDARSIPEQVQFTYPLILPLQEAHRAEYKDPQEYKYGPHARHNLDVYRPEASGESKIKYPVLMFAYGGGFMQGDKRASTGAYMALGNYFSRRGFVTIVVDYRRIPDTGKFPDSAEDLSLSLQWLAQGLIAEVDPDCVFYLGASAGGMNLATLMWGSFPDIAHPSSIRGIRVRGIMFLSIKYHSSAGGDVPLKHPMYQYYGSPEAFLANSPYALRSKSKDKTPLLAMHAEYDPKDELKKEGSVPAFVDLYEIANGDFGPFETYECRGHNHISLPLVLGLGGPPEAWAEYAILWMRKLIQDN